MKKNEEIAKFLEKLDLTKKPKEQAVYIYHSVIDCLNAKAENTRYMALCNPNGKDYDKYMASAEEYENQASMTAEGAGLFVKIWILNNFLKTKKYSKLLSKENITPNSLRTFSDTINRIFEICENIHETRFDELDPKFDITEDERILKNLSAISRDANVVYSEMNKNERLKFSTMVLSEVTSELSEIFYNKDANVKSNNIKEK